MPRLQSDQSGWTTEDRATFAKWRRLVCMFYGSLCFLLLVGIGSYAAQSGRTNAMVATMSAPMHR
jgi:hypothetical protein